MRISWLSPFHRICRQDIGNILVQRILQAFPKGRIFEIKVLVGDKLEAHAFYRKLELRHVHHINYDNKITDANIYLIETGALHGC